MQAIAANDAGVYGINTGFGMLASTHIPRDQLDELQHNLILSHAVGIGALLPPTSCGWCCAQGQLPGARLLRRPLVVSTP